MLIFFEEEKKKLKYLADELGLSMSGFLKKCIEEKWAEKMDHKST